MPADTLFYYAAQGRWDAVVAMYHDQGLIPFKMLSFEEGVNVTLGLPFVRTSPDHGTAFDIAWKGVANPASMIRKKNESIIIDGRIRITVVEVRGDKVRLGIEAPREVPVHRSEVLEAIRREEQAKLAQGGQQTEETQSTS